jgi:hypothetical protein
MIIKNVIFSIDELNTQSGCVRQFCLNDDCGSNYIDRNIIIDNLTGDTIEYGILTQKEYTEYVNTSGDITNLIPLENETNDCLNRIDGNPAYVIAKGTTSGYINNLVISSIHTNCGDMDITRMYSHDFELTAISGVVIRRGFDAGFDGGFN